MFLEDQTIRPESSICTTLPAQPTGDIRSEEPAITSPGITAAVKPAWLTRSRESQRTRATGMRTTNQKLREIDDCR